MATSCAWVSIGEDGWSRELCGGTHIDHVGKIGAINIMSEASIGSGVRRVDAVVGESAYEFNAREHALVSQLSDMVNARPDELADRVNALLARLKESDRLLRPCTNPSLRLRACFGFRNQGIPGSGQGGSEERRALRLFRRAAQDRAGCARTAR